MSQPTDISSLNDIIQGLFGKPVCPVCKDSDRIALQCLKCGRKPK